MSVDLSVIILTFNEQDNLRAALDSVVGWSKRVFVIDSLSTDRTVDIALEYRDRGVQVIQHPFVNYGAQWNWAIEHLPIETAWILKLDADERVTAPFREEVGQFIREAQTETSAAHFRREFVFMGSLLRYGGMSDGRVTHLWRTGKARFEDRPINEHLIVTGAVHALKHSIVHHSFASLSDWIAKHNRYSSLEALRIGQGDVTGGVTPRLFGSPDERRMWLKRLYFNVPARPLCYFFYQYLFKAGFLDGWPGFRFALLHALYFYWIDLKLIEWRASGHEPVVAWPERGRPHSGVEFFPI